MNTVAKIDTSQARPAHIDPAEWETRVDLAACYRLVDHYGMTDLHLNHIWARVAYHDFEGVAVELDERERIVKDLGDAEVMVLRNHGLLSVGQTIGQAFNNIYRLERACQTQLLALACNSEIAMPPQQVIDRSNAQLTVQPAPDAAGRRRPHGSLEWPALKRMLDRRDPSYKT